MTHYKEKTFQKEEVILDGNTFEDCTFDSCVLSYSGYRPTGFAGVAHFKRASKISLNGPALSGIYFLKYLRETLGEFGTEYTEHLIAGVKGEKPIPPMPNIPHKTQSSIYINKETGVWAFASEDEKQVASELENDTARAAAIIAASIVELRIRACILARCNRHKDIESRLFRPSGPLGSFSAKIDLAYLMGVLTEDAYHDLVIIKDIRNSFAHHLNIKDFNSDTIKQKTDKLRLINSRVGNFTGKEGETLINPNDPQLNIWNYEERMKIPRDRYLTTCQLITIAAIAGEMITTRVPII